MDGILDLLAGLFGDFDFEEIIASIMDYLMSILPF